MRVLYLSHRIPYPPDKGDKIRAFHQLRAISARHEVDVFTLADDPADLAGQRELARFCHEVTVCRLQSTRARLRSLPFLATRKPLTLPYFCSAELHAKVRAALSSRSYDRIFVYCSAMAQYVEEVEQIPILTDLVDVDSDKWTQYARFAPFPYSAIYRREGLALRKYEKKLCARSALTLVTTSREAQILRQIAPDARVEVVPNGVNADYFAPPLPRAETVPPTLTFVGDMSYFPNQQAVQYFVRDVLPRVRQAVSAVRFYIVGRNPSAEVRRLERIPGVVVTGFVPDIRTYLSETRVVVAPFLIAAGIQNKILEAMAFGLPVVATPRAIQGLVHEAAELVGVADTTEGLARQTADLLRDPERAHRIGLDGRRRVMECYDWSRCLEPLVSLLENPAGTPGTRTMAAFPR